MRDKQVARLRALGVLTALTMALVMIFAYTVRAEACTTVQLDRGQITGRSDAPGIQVSGSGGTMLLVNIGSFDGPEGWEGFTGETSAVIPDGATEATVCPDGGVAFLISAADPMPVPVVVDIPASQMADTPSAPTPDPEPLSDEIPWAPYEARV